MTDNPLRRAHEGVTPPPALKGRVESALREAGHLERRRRALGVVGRRAIALAAAVLVGFVAGRTRIESVPAGPRYALLLYEDAGYRDDRPMREIVAEYAGWADSLDSAGVLVAAERLSESRQDVVGSGVAMPARGAEPTGLFIVRAAADDAATAIARGSPHLRYGGRIVVRRIERGSDR